MNVEFEYLENTIIYHTQDGGPVYGDVVEFTIDGQKFRQINDLNTIRSAPWIKVRDTKLSHYMFGKALMEIGRKVVTQATHGIESVKLVNGTKIISF